MAEELSGTSLELLLGQGGVDQPRIAMEGGKVCMADVSSPTGLRQRIKVARLEYISGTEE